MGKVGRDCCAKSQGLFDWVRISVLDFKVNMELVSRQRREKFVFCVWGNRIIANRFFKRS